MAIQRVDTAEQFHIEYPRCRNWLIEALNYSENEITERDLLIGLQERDYLLWTTDNAACVTSLTEWESKRVCVLFLIGGNKGKAMREILFGGQPIVEAWAKSMGCDGLLGIGRDLWKNVLPAHGFIIKGNTYYKDIA